MLYLTSSVIISSSFICSIKPKKEYMNELWVGKQQEAVALPELRERQAAGAGLFSLPKATTDPFGVDPLSLGPGSRLTAAVSKLFILPGKSTVATPCLMFST